MSDWMQSTVEELFRMGRGRVISGIEISNNPGYHPVYSSQTSDNGCMGFISTFDFEGEFVTWTTDGANAGTVFYRDGQFNCTNVCGTLKAKNENTVDHRFFASLLSILTKRHVSYIGNPKLMNGVMGKIHVYYPRIEQQRKIAQILDTLDTTIRKTEAIIEKLKQIKQGLLHDLLTRGIAANGELRPPYEQAPHLYKESPLGWIPKEWDLASLESISSAVTSGSRNWALYYADSGALFIRIGNLTREHINLRFDSIIYANPPRYADGQRTKLEAGDLLISITADLGIVGVVSEGFGDAYINQHIAMVRLNQDYVNSRFIGHYLAGTHAQQNISQLNDSGAKAGLNLPTIRNIQVVVPNRTEQYGIALRLDEADLRIKNARTELAKLQNTKAGLIDDLLTGRVRVTPLLQQDKPHD